MYIFCHNYGFLYNFDFLSFVTYYIIIATLYISSFQLFIMILTFCQNLKILYHNFNFLCPNFDFFMSKLWFTQAYFLLFGLNGLLYRLLQWFCSIFVGRSISSHHSQSAKMQLVSVFRPTEMHHPAELYQNSSTVQTKSTTGSDLLVINLSAYLLWTTGTFCSCLKHLLTVIFLFVCF